MDIKETQCEGADYIYLAQNRDHVNMVPKFWGSIKGRRILLHVVSLCWWFKKVQNPINHDYNDGLKLIYCMPTFHEF